MEHQTLGQLDDRSIDPATQRIILKIVEFLVCSLPPIVALPQPSYMSLAIKHAKELLSGQASSFTLVMGVEHMKMNKNEC